MKSHPPSAWHGAPALTSWIVLTFSLLALAVPAGGAVADELLDDATYQQAHRAFVEGRYDDAEGIFAQLANQYPDRSEPRFWQAYAAHKQGDAAIAQVAIRAALEIEPDSIDALYLAALLAHGRGDRADAIAMFQRVAELQPEGELGFSARRHLDSLTWQAALDAAIERVAGGDLEGAASELERLSATRPGDATILYYQGYVAYHRGDAEGALTYLDAALAVQPDDGWSRYMRALALNRLGEAETATAALTDLTVHPDAEIAWQASTTLAKIQRAAERSRVSSARSAAGAGAPAKNMAGSWRLGVGIDVDTNPAYVPESSYVSAGETSVAVAVRVRGEQPLLRRGGTTLFLGPRGLVRAYPSGPTEYDLAQVTARLELHHQGRKLTGWIGGGGGVSFLGWRLFLDIEELYAGGAWQQAAWSSSRLSLSGYRRGSHLDDYQNLDAWGGRAALSQRLQPDSVFRAELGYAVQGEKADGYEVSWDGLTSDADAVPYVATLSADATFFGHGPLVSVRVNPPWQDLRLTASAALQWRNYQAPEQVEYDVAGSISSWEGERKDRRLNLSAAASVRTVWKLHVFLRYSAVLNTSSLTGDDSPVDRNYDRHLVSAGVEVRL